MGHYEVLGVARDAEVAEVRQAYVALARRHHPDNGGSTERMQALNEAWAVLGDAARRERYDLTLTRPSGPRPSGVWSAGADGPDAAPRSPLEDLLDDLLDDRPIHAGVVRLPPWLAMIPPGTAALATLLLVVGLVIRLPAFLALGFGLGALSVLLFLLSPFVALAASHRDPGGSGKRPGNR